MTRDISKIPMTARLDAIEGRIITLEKYIMENLEEENDPQSSPLPVSICKYGNTEMTTR